MANETLEQEANFHDKESCSLNGFYCSTTQMNCRDCEVGYLEIEEILDQIANQEQEALSFHNGERCNVSSFDCLDLEQGCKDCQVSEVYRTFMHFLDESSTA